MKIADAIPLVLGGFLIGFGIFLKVAPREGLWTGLAVMLICFGVTLLGTGIAAQIARSSRRSRKPSLTEMREPREKKLHWDAAAGAALGDPFGLLCTLCLGIKFWKVSLILLAVIAAVVLITGLVMLWVNRWDI